MKRFIAILLVFSMIVSLAGCQIDIDTDELVDIIEDQFENIVEEEQHRLFAWIEDWIEEKTNAFKQEAHDFIISLSEDAKNFFSLGTYEDEKFANQTWPFFSFETEPDPFGAYVVVSNNENRDIRITRVDLPEHAPIVFLIDRDIDFDTFKSYAGGDEYYTDYELEIMLSLYKAQDIGIELLLLLQAIQEGQEPYKNVTQKDDSTQFAAAQAYVKSFKWWLDTSFSLVENAEETKDIAMSKDDFLAACLGDGAPKIIKGGEIAEKAASIIRTAISIHRFSNRNAEEKNHIENTQEATTLMLDIIDTTLELAPSELLLSQVYSSQLEALKQSCDGYFAGCQKYMTLLEFVDAHNNSMAVSRAFISLQSDGNSEWDTFIQVFSAGGVRSCWGAEHMPTLGEMLDRLSQPVVPGSTLTVYDQIKLDDAYNNTNHQYWILKYIEFRIHYEFEELTGITIECYYDLMKLEGKWYQREKAPWEKGIDPDAYTPYNPTIENCE